MSTPTATSNFMVTYCNLHGKQDCDICVSKPNFTWPSVPALSMGWQCPSCRRCYAPTYQRCDYCPGTFTTDKSQ